MNRKGTALPVAMLVILTIILAYYSWSQTINKGVTQKMQLGEAEYLNEMYKQRTEIRNQLTTELRKAVVAVSNKKTEIGEYPKEVIDSWWNLIDERTIRENNIMKENIQVMMEEGIIIATIKGMKHEKNFRNELAGLTISYDYEEEIRVIKPK